MTQSALAGTTAADRPPARVHLGGERSRARRLWPIALFAAAAFLVLGRAWLHPATQIPGFPDDNKSFLWGLSWFAWSLSHGHDPLVTTYVHAPAGINVLWNAWSPPLAVLLAPLTLTAGPEASYDVLVTAAFALSGTAGWRAATRFVRPGTAVAVGLAYELSPFMLGHGGEDPMLVFAVFPPVVLLLLTDLFRGVRTPVRIGALLGLSTAAQAWVDEELATDVALVVVIGLLVGLVAARARVADSWRPLALGLSVAAGVGLVLTAPLLAVQFLGPDRITTMIRPTYSSYFLDLRTLVVPTQRSVFGRLAGGDLSRYSAVEATGYLGLLPVLALIATVRQRTGQATRILAGTALVTGIIALGINASWGTSILFYPMPWAALDGLPLIGQLQPARLTLEIFLLVAILAGRGADQLRQQHLRTTVALAAVTAVSLLPVLPLTETTRPTAPAFFRAGATALPAGCLAAVAPVAYVGSNDNAMVWQAAADFRFRMLGGYVLGPLLPGQASVYAPQPYPMVAWLVQVTAHGHAPTIRPTDAAARADLAAQHVCAIVIGYPGQHPDLVRAVTRLEGRPPQLTGDVALWQLEQSAG